MLRAARLFAIACAALAFAACSSSEPQPDGEPDAGGHRRLEEDAEVEVLDGGIPIPHDDAAVHDDATIAPDAAPMILMEVEGTHERTNDDFTSGESCPVGSTIHGTIGDLVLNTYDLDYYRFRANEGDVLRVTLAPEAGSMLEPYFVVIDETEDYQRAGDTTREVYIDWTGPFAVIVGDARNAEDPPMNLGGEMFTYALTIERVTPAVTPVTLPLSHRAAMIDANNALAIFELTLGANETITAETFAARLDTPSDVDTILIFEDHTGTSTSPVLAEADDIDYENGITDSALEGTTKSAGAHRVIVDFYYAGADKTYELSARSSATPVPHGVVINELDYDNPSSDTAELVELYNGGSAGVALDSLALIFINGLNGSEYRRVALNAAGPTLGAGQYLVVAMDGVAVAPGALVIRDNGTAQNGAPDGVLLFDTATETVLDALSYEGEITTAMIDGSTVMPNLVEGTAATAVDSDSTPGALSRCPNGADTNDADTDWAFRAMITAGADNDCP